jgi:8-hydroxy-5-deazaflavin:NADPH oxidoreductase
MKIGILGSGGVGQALGKKFIELGHEVVIGTRDPNKLDDKKNFAGSLTEWLSSVNNKGRVVSFKDAAAHGDLIVNSLHATKAVEVLRGLAHEMDGKPLIDLGNELDFTRGMPPHCLAHDDNSLAEKIQTVLPNVHVVKTLNTVSAALMTNPRGLADGDHTLFISGNNALAKETVTRLLESMGWKDILDLGDISSAKGPEMLLALWAHMWGRLKSPMINIKVVRP